MNTQVKTRLIEFIKTWALIEDIFTGVFLVSAILVFFGYAIYSAAHHVTF